MLGIMARDLPCHETRKDVAVEAAETAAAAVLRRGGETGVETWGGEEFTVGASTTVAAMGTTGDGVGV